jgi:hypothetical protein
MSMSREGIHKFLHQMRLFCTRPIYTLSKGDANQQQAFEKHMDLIKNLITLDSLLLYVDELPCSSALNPASYLIGNGPTEKQYGHHVHVSLVGVVNVLNGETILYRVSAANAQLFLIS